MVDHVEMLKSECLALGDMQRVYFVSFVNIEFLHSTRTSLLDFLDQVDQRRHDEASTSPSFGVVQVRNARSTLLVTNIFP